MLKSNKEELLEFLNQQNPKESLKEASFRILCFMHNPDRTRKPWLWYNQDLDKGTAEIVFKDGPVVSDQLTIKETLDIINSLND